MSKLNLSEIINESGRYIIPVSWTLFSNVIVEADNLQEALDICRKRIDDIPLGDGEYLDGSYQIDAENDEEAFEAQSYSEFGGVTIHKNGDITRD